MPKSLRKQFNVKENICKCKYYKMLVKIHFNEHLFFKIIFMYKDIHENWFLTNINETTVL